MCERHIEHARAAEFAQQREVAVDRLPALDAEHRRDPAAPVDAHDVVGVRERFHVKAKRTQCDDKLMWNACVGAETNLFGRHGRRDRTVGSEAKGYKNVLFAEARKRFEDPRHIRAGGELAHDRFQVQPRPRNDGLAAHNSGINDGPFGNRFTDVTLHGTATSPVKIRKPPPCPCLSPPPAWRDRR